MSSADLFQDEERLLTGSHKEAQTASDEHVALGYAIYPARWWQLTLFSLLSISNALLWITFAPITTQVQGFYDVSLLWVNLLSVVFMVAYVPMVFPASFYLDKYGLRFGLLLGALGNAIGACVRAIGFNPATFALCFIGQTLAAIAQPFILNAPPIVAANWFPDNQRTIATTVASVANPLGVAAGFVLPPAIASNKEYIPLLLGIEAGISIVVLLLLFWQVKDKPPLPPSASAMPRADGVSLWKATKALFTNAHFVLLFVSFSLALGTFNTLATLLNEIIEPYEYDSIQTGALGAVVIFLGLVGSGAIGALVDVYHVYKYSLIGTMVGGCVSMILFTVLLAKDRFWSLLVLASLLGFTLMPVLPLGLELSCEISYPIGEAVPSGYLMTGGQIVGIVLIVGLNALIENAKEKWALWIMCVCVAFAGWLMLMFRHPLKRLLHEKNTQEQGALSVNPDIKF